MRSLPIVRLIFILSSRALSEESWISYEDALRFGLVELFLQNFFVLVLLFLPLIFFIFPLLLVSTVSLHKTSNFLFVYFPLNCRFSLLQGEIWDLSNLGVWYKHCQTGITSCSTIHIVFHSHCFGSISSFWVKLLTTWCCFSIWNYDLVVYLKDAWNFFITEAIFCYGAFTFPFLK